MFDAEINGHITFAGFVGNSSPAAAVTATEAIFVFLF